MIEINLIPDVKQEFIKAQKMRKAAITISILVGAAAAGVVVVLILLLGAQALHETISRGQIDSEFKKFKAVNDIDNVLTIQNQLDQIATIHGNKTMDSRMFDVLAAINPAAPNDVRISSVKLNPDDSTLTIEGSAQNGYAATETFRKLILNTELKSISGTDSKTEPLTSEVTLGETSYGEGPDGGKVLRFSLSFVYPEVLFSNSVKSVSVVTPNSAVDVTDSRTRVPTSLFGEQAKDLQGGN
jgi:hypothetical protein